MTSIEEYIEQGASDKLDLQATLAACEVSLTPDETFTTLVPKNYQHIKYLYLMVLMIFQIMMILKVIWNLNIIKKAYKS